MHELKAMDGTSFLIQEATSFVLVTTSPLFLLFYCIAYEHFGASLVDTAYGLLDQGPSFFLHHLPYPTTSSILTYLVWVAFQAVLYVTLPGPIHHGPRTPGGKRMPYRLNGLLAWIITIVVGVAVSYFGLIDPALIAKQWSSLLATASLYCATLIFVFQIKARLWPDHAADTLFTGGFWYDLFNGGELHPRTGQMFDWKHFNASRTGGLLTWTLIDLSFAAFQYEKFGTLTNSMILAVVFRLGIVAEYFVWENWFFETLDGAHERFSFYNIYGFAAMLPHLWTLQTQYLTLYPVDLSPTGLIAIIALFVVGTLLQHSVNGQKSLARETAGNCIIWGSKAKVLEATYKTSDGKTHRTVLLCSGWWGIMRHGNYLGTIIYTWASCFVCGAGHISPYIEAILVTGITIHRCLRDEARCREKYGSTWDEYCRVVKWRMIPGIY